MKEDLNFSYRGVRATGERIADVIHAPDRVEALRRLEREDIVVTRLELVADAAPAVPLWRRRSVTDQERILLLRQIALMTRAGVELLETLETLAGALRDRPIAAGLRAFAAALRRGDRIETAFRNGLPGYPTYVYALVGAGEASGRMDSVLDEAARQLSFEQTLRRDLRGALAYPTFLVCAALIVMSFLFAVVVPRFAAMIGDGRANISGLARVVLDAGAYFGAHPIGSFMMVAAALTSLVLAVASKGGRRFLAQTMERIPGLRDLVFARQRTTWARIMAFALTAGVGLFPAAELAVASAPEGRFRTLLTGAFRGLRAGRPVDEAFGAAGALDSVDRSLLRAGERSGALAPMFTAIAERHEEDLRRTLKTVTTFLEQAAIAFVALSIGAVVIGIVLALTGLYDSVG